MKPEPAFDLIRFLLEVNSRKIRYLLIGRWAVAQYGAPVVTADFDFWVAPQDRKRFLDLLEETFEAELPDLPARKRPFSRVYVGPDQIDCFSHRRIINREGEELVFDEVYGRCQKKQDPEGTFFVTVPSLDDLIALKKFDVPDPLKQQRNLEDIRFLLTLKKTASGKGRRR